MFLQKDLQIDFEKFQFGSTAVVAQILPPIGVTLSFLVSEKNRVASATNSLCLVAAVDYLYNNTVLDIGIIMSVILFVRYRNHFPVVQFQNQAHIWNPHGTGHVFKTIWGAEGTPILFLSPPKASGAPFLSPVCILFHCRHE